MENPDPPTPILKPGQIFKYGTVWNAKDDLDIEMGAIRLGGRWKSKQGVMCGDGLFNHWKRYMSLLWPSFQWHRWSELLLKICLGILPGYEGLNEMIAVLGPKSSGKTFFFSRYALACYWLWPDNTCVLNSSTDLRGLQLRIWGDIITGQSHARSIHSWLPGKLTDSRLMITTESDDETVIRDRRKGLIGIPCKRGNQYVGLSGFQGIKQDHMILVADEGQLMPFGFLDAESNLNANEHHQFIVLGNPIGQGDALERVYEPDPSEGSLDTLIDYTDPKTKVWKTTWSGGIAVNLVGSDSPNFDVPEGEPIPYPKLVTRSRIAKDAHSYGKDSWKYYTFSIGVPPRGTSTFRVITLDKCKQFGAFEDFAWESHPTLKWMALDAAYGGVGGDRCVAGEFWSGKIVGGLEVIALVGGCIIVPVKASHKKIPEDQIAEFMLSEMNARGISLNGKLFYDSTGRGSLGTSFARAGITPVPVEFGGKATDRPIRKGEKKTCNEEYRNFVSELWFQSALLIESGQSRGITKDMVREAELRTWELVGSAGMQKTQVLPKSEMKELLGKSPDLWDMYVTGIEGARRMGFSIRAIGEEHKKNNQKWLHDLRQKSRELHKREQLVYTP